jgi:tRNA threonylcarbamoyl adenosine modification protein YeaZ
VLVLALDTSSAATWAAVCAVDSGVEVLVVNTSVDARAHGERLAPNIAASLEQSGARASDLGAIVVGTGPGPFTGLRVGLVTAAVLAETLRIPAYGVCSLDGLAEHPNALLVAADARRKEVYWATYRAGVRTAGPAVARPADVPTAGLEAMVGAGARLHAGVLGLPLLDGDHPSPPALVIRALDRIRQAAPSEPLTPLYLRRPDAVVPAAAKQVTR